MLHLALFQPDIAANTGAMMRLCACLGVAMDIIEPCGFVLDDKRLQRGAMDYTEALIWQRHRDWPAFTGAITGKRLILLTTKATQFHHQFTFGPDDVLLMGRESAGVPDEIRQSVPDQVKIPLYAGARSLNVATAAALVLGEALRQTNGWPAS